LKPFTHFLLAAVFLVVGAQHLSADHFAASGSMSQARTGHTATLLPDGRVLVTGGQNVSGALRTAEIYNPSTGGFSSTGSMAQPRVNAVATLLADGRVLVTGGFNFTAETFTNLTTAEIYNPATSQFTATASMNVPRTGHSATLLHDGRVFVVGGTSSNIRQAEIFDPAASTFTTLPLMLVARAQAVAFTLPNGNVLVAGGNLQTAAGAEIFNVNSGQFEAAPTRTLFSTGTHGAAVLASGRILIAGSIGTSGASALSEVFDPASGIFLPTGSLNLARSNHATAALGDGRALVTGGAALGADQTVRETSSAELFDPATFQFRLAASMLSPRAGHTATTLSNGTALIIGGTSGGVFLQTAETYVADAVTVPVPRRRAARH
jgi:hypothetical protein